MLALAIRWRGRSRPAGRVGRDPGSAAHRLGPVRGLPLGQRRASGLRRRQQGPRRIRHHGLCPLRRRRRRERDRAQGAPVQLRGLSGRPRYGNFDIILGRFARIAQHHTHTRARTRALRMTCFKLYTSCSFSSDADWCLCNPIFLADSRLQDMWDISGIERDVFLLSRPSARIWDFWADAGLQRPSYRSGELNITAEIAGESMSEALQLGVAVIDRVQSLRRQFDPPSSARFHQRRPLGAVSRVIHPAARCFVLMGVRGPGVRPCGVKNGASGHRPDRARGDHLRPAGAAGQLPTDQGHRHAWR